MIQAQMLFSESDLNKALALIPTVGHLVEVIPVVIPPPASPPKGAKSTVAFLVISST